MPDEPQQQQPTSASAPPLSRSARRRRARKQQQRLYGDALYVPGPGGPAYARPMGKDDPWQRAKKASTKPSGQLPKPEPPSTDIAGQLGVPKGGFKSAALPRQTLPVNANVLGALPWNFLPRRQYESYDLSSLASGEFGAQQLIDLLSDAWPDMAQALWNNLMLAKSELKLDVRTFDNEHDDPAGKAELDAILARVNEHWGGFDALVSQFIMTTALQGACAGETIPTTDVEDVDDIVAVQPWTMYFQRSLEQKYIPFQWQPMLAASGAAALAGSYWDVPAEPVAAIPNPSAKAPGSYELLNMQALNHGGFRMLNTATFGYVPFLPDVDDPYGRLPFAPALQMVVFDAQLLKDLRQWAHTHAWGRLDVKVLFELAQQAMPASVKNDVEKRAAWLNQYLGDIVSAYNGVNPDDTFVHWDSVEVTGIAATGQTFDVDNLVRIVERKVFRALKQLPVLMGSNEGTTETHGTVQMEVYAKGIEAIQHAVAALLEHLLTAALRIRGRTSRVVCAFKTMRTSDRMQDAAAEKLEIQNAASKRDQNWITQDEASIDITGSKAEGPPPDPDPVVAPLQPDAAAETSGHGVAPASTPADGTQPPAATPNAPNPDAAKETMAKDQADTAANDAKQKGVETAAQVGNPPTAKLADPKFANQTTGTAGVTVGRSMSGDAAESDDEAPDSEPHTGVMVACFLDPETARALALDPETLDLEMAQVCDPLPPDELHLTLTFHGDGSRFSQEERQRLVGTVAEFAAQASPLAGRVAGVGRFNPNPQSDGQSAVFALVDIHGLRDWRADLVNALQGQGFSPDTTFEYQPHITLAYCAPDAPMPVDRAPDDLAFTFSHVTLALGDQRLAYRLGGEPPEPPDRDASSAETDEVVAKQLPPAGRAALTVVDDATERAALAALAGRLFAAALVQQRTDRAAHTPNDEATRHAPDPRQHQLTGEARQHVGKYLRAQKPTRQQLAHILDLHTSRAVAGNRRNIAGHLATAVGLCADAMETGVPASERATDDQQQALIASIARMLYVVFPEQDEALATVLVEASAGAWDAAGEAALRRLGLPGSFHLTNKQLAATIQQQAATDASGISTTSRQRIAALIASDLLDGATAAELAAGIQEQLDGWAEDASGSRADTIARSTISQAWFAASLTTWGRNGVPMKQWFTNGDPDPGSIEKPCQDNEDAGPIPLGQPFPTGVQGPPQHPICYCTVEPAGDLSAVSTLDADAVWTGD